METNPGRKQRRQKMTNWTGESMKIMTTTYLIEDMKNERFHNKLLRS